MTKREQWLVAIVAALSLIFWTKLCLGQEAGTVRAYRQQARSAQEARNDHSAFFTPGYREYTQHFVGVDSVSSYAAAVDKFRQWKTAKLYEMRDKVNKHSRKGKSVREKINQQILELNSTTIPLSPPGMGDLHGRWFDAAQPELFTSIRNERTWTTTGGKAYKGTAVLMDDYTVTIDNREEQFKIRLVTLSGADRRLLKSLWQNDNKHGRK